MDLNNFKSCYHPSLLDHVAVSAFSLSPALCRAGRTAARVWALIPPMEWYFARSKL